MTNETPEVQFPNVSDLNASSGTMAPTPAPATTHAPVQQQVIQPIAVEETPTVEDNEFPVLNRHGDKVILVDKPVVNGTLIMEGSDNNRYRITWQPISETTAAQNFATMITALNRKDALNTGNQTRRNSDSMKQLDSLSDLDDFYMSILAERVVTLTDGLPEDDTWHDYLLMNKQIMKGNPHYDSSKSVMKETMFLRYVIFRSQENLDLLTQYVTNVVTG